MTTTVNKNDLANAHYVKQQVSPAIEALRKITPHAVGCVEAHEKILAFSAWLEGFEGKADSVISRANAQFEARPQGIINAAACRLLEIPECISRERAAASSKAEGHARKVEELKTKNFSESEIQAILPFPQEELDAHADAITDLQNELKNLQSFLASAPAYDVNLLSMEKLSPFMQHCKSAE